MTTADSGDAEVAQLVSSLLDRVEFEAEGCLVTGLEFGPYRRRLDSESSCSSSSSGGGDGLSDNGSVSGGTEDEEEGDDSSRRQTGQGRGRGSKPSQQQKQPRQRWNPLGDLAGVIGPVERLTLSVPPEVAMRHCATVTSLLGALVVAQSEPEVAPLDINSVLFLADRQPLGQVLDVFGPVSRPFYSILLPTAEVVAELGVAVGQPLLFADEDSLRHFILPARLVATQPRPSDASWLGDQEPPAECLDYSDDEAERLAKRQAKRHPDAEADDGEDNDDTASVASSSAADGSGQQQQQRRKPARKRQQFQHPNQQAQQPHQPRQMTMPHSQRPSFPQRWPPNRFAQPYQHQAANQFRPSHRFPARQQHQPYQHPPQQHQPFQHPPQHHQPYQHPPQQYQPYQHPPQQRQPHQHPPQQHQPYQNPPQQHQPYQNPPQQHQPYQHPPQQHQPYQNPPQQHQPYQHLPQQHQPYQHPPQSHAFEHSYEPRFPAATEDARPPFSSRPFSGSHAQSGGSTSWPPPLNQRPA